MREVFLIGCHITNELQLSYLSELIHKLKSAQKDYIIISHTHIPHFLTKGAKAYLYDSDNHVIKGHDLGVKYLYWYATDNFRLKSTTLGFGSSDNYSIAVLNLLIRGSYLCRSLGYDVCHWVEYDFDLNIEESQINYNLICKNHNIGLIGYVTEYQINYDQFINESVVNHIFGSFFTYNLKNFNSDYFIIDKSELIKQVKKFNFGAEFFIENTLFLKDSEKVLKRLSDYKFVNRSSTSNKVQYSLFNKNGKLNLFIYNPTSSIQEVIVEMSSFRSNFEIKPHCWSITSIESQISNLVLVCGDSVIADINLLDPIIYDYYVQSSIFEEF